jgi:hypothetical protein
VVSHKTTVLSLTGSVICILFRQDKTNINYGPVSLLTGISKIFEKLLYKRVMHHLNSNDILVDERFSFRQDMSTNKAAYKLTHELNALSSKSNVQ